MKPTNRCRLLNGAKTLQDNNQKFLKTVIEEMTLEMTLKTKENREELKMNTQMRRTERFHQPTST